MNNMSDNIVTPTGNQLLLIRRGGVYKESDATVRECGELVDRKVSLPAGEVIKTIEDNNLILSRFRTQLSRLCVGTGVSTRFINRMCWGTGGHAIGDPSTPVAPETGDTALDSTVLVKALSTYSFPSDTAVMITAFILEGEGNGFTITESGLLCADNTLVARRTFGGQNKTKDFVFEFRWTLFF